MPSELRWSDEELASAGIFLTGAAHQMLTGSVARPRGELASLSGIGADVRTHLLGVSVARAALADAAKTAAQSLSQLMAASGELDETMAALLGEGFAVRGAPT